MEEKIKTLLSDENYVNALFDLGSYEAAAAKLQEDGVEASAEELKMAVEIALKKESGEISDEDLEQIYGGFCFSALIGPAIFTAAVTGLVVRQVRKNKGKC